MRVQKKPLSTDTIIAIAATVTSVCALLIAVYQTILSREQQLNSVWPYLIIYEKTEDGQSTIEVTNNGVGPAIIERIDIRYRGQAYKNMVEVIQAMSKQVGRGSNGISWIHADLTKGFVIPQGQTFDWISAINKNDYAIFGSEIGNIKASIYFKSIYDEHWRSNYHVPNEDLVSKE